MLRSANSRDLGVLVALESAAIEREVGVQDAMPTGRRSCVDCDPEDVRSCRRRQSQQLRHGVGTKSVTCRPSSKAWAFNFGGPTAVVTRGVEIARAEDKAGLTVLPCCGLPLLSRVTKYTSTSLPPSCAFWTPFLSVDASESAGFARWVGLPPDADCSWPGRALTRLEAADSTAFLMAAILRLAPCTGELRLWRERKREREASYFSIRSLRFGERRLIERGG